jgi:hypothetical protein
MVGATTKKLVGLNWCSNPVNTGSQSFLTKIPVGLRRVHTKHPSSKSCFSAFHIGIPIGDIRVRIEPATTKNTQVNDSWRVLIHIRISTHFDDGLDVINLRGECAISVSSLRHT